MKIMFIIATNTSGGSERVMATLANCFSQLGHETYYVNTDLDSGFYPLLPAVRQVKLKADGGEGSLPGRVWVHLRIFKRLFRLIRKTRPDAAVVFLFHSELPVILSCRALRVPVFTSVRNSANVYPLSHRLFRRCAYPGIAGVVFQSRRVRESPDFRKLKNAAVIMNPLSGAGGEPFESAAAVRDSLKLISVGRLIGQKNHALLIRAFCKTVRKYPQAKLHIFGVGRLRDELTALAASLGLSDSVVFEGEVKDAIPKNRDAGLFVLSSDFEGFPNALVEAMACGIPVISSDFDSGVAAELIEDGVNGCLFRVGDEAELAEKIDYVLSDPARAAGMAQKALAVRGRLEYFRIGREWETFIASRLR